MMNLVGWTGLALVTTNEALDMIGRVIASATVDEQGFVEGSRPFARASSISVSGADLGPCV